MRLYAFFELRRMRLARWTAAVLLVCLGIGIFLWNVDDLRSYEATRREPVNVGAVCLAVMLTAVGMAIGGYGIALENSRFYAWRVRKAQKRNACGPDYGKDVFMAAMLLMILFGIVMGMCYPAACGLMAFVLILVCGLAFNFVPFYKKFAPK